MNQTLNVDVGMSTWFALNRARELGYLRARYDSWTTDVDMASLSVPSDCTVLWEDVRNATHDIVIESPKAIVYLSQDRRTLSVSVYGADQDADAILIARLREMMPQSERQSNLLDVTFWYHTHNGPRSYDRQLDAPTWADIEANYPAGTRASLAALQTIKVRENSGKLLLWQGEPGTGKTFALRALAEEWASWCRIHYVLDPEKFFTEGDYLLSVILGNDDMPQAVGAVERPPWRLVVLEDAGEMLAKDAKMQVGQGLARLLNLCDGLLGQGLRVMVLITTNEQVGSLHAAVSRPGRCLSQISFEKFDAVGAAAWLEGHGRPAAVVKSATLADLYALTGGAAPPKKNVVGF